MFVKILLVLLHIITTCQFIDINQLKHLTVTKCQPLTNICACNERIIYTRYLLGLRSLRKTGKILNATNVNALASILNFTNDFISNHTSSDTLSINNSETSVKNIIMGNIVLDVSKVEYIHISTKKDRIVIELDKKEKDLFGMINNLDSYINTIALLGKLMNIN